ncbi:nucleotidyltransferase domain-containing protein [Bdellovibrionota bacterium FG-1]
MARVRKSVPTLDSVFFSTPDQKVMRLLLSEPTTLFTLRTMSSKLKGVRGLGGVEGLMRILTELEALGLVDFVDNHRGVRLQNDNTVAQTLKRFTAICDLESLQKLMEPVCSKGILMGSRASGRARSDSDYDLFVVTNTPHEAKEIAGSHPLGKNIEVIAWTPEMVAEIGKQDPKLALKLEQGIVLWGSTW